MSDEKIISILEICERTGLSEAALRHFIENEWLSPVAEETFDEEDLARARLIQELREDFGVNEASVPIVLHLLDQLYALREQLRRRGLR